MTDSPENTAATLTSRSRALRPLSLLGVAFACVLLGSIAAAAFGGYQTGVSQREAQLRATQTADLELQFNLGTADLAAGRYEVAAERFAYILSLDPDYPGAAENLASARAALKITPTPPATPIPTPASQDATGYFALAEQYLAAGDWDGVITQLAILRGLDPAYEPVRVDGMLFVALRNRGLARIQGESMEAGIFDLDQAGAFAPLDTEAVNYRAWARLYLNAQSYWGVNWRQTVEILELLYALAPNFKDTSVKYYQAARSYAAELEALGDACGASNEYLRALTLFVDPSVAEAQAAAQAACEATPDPEAQPTLDPLAEPTPDESPTPAP